MVHTQYFTVYGYQVRYCRFDNRVLMSAAMRSRSFDQHLHAFVLDVVRKEYFLGRADVSCSSDSLEAVGRSTAITIEDEPELACRSGKSSEAPSVVWLFSAIRHARSHYETQYTYHVRI